MKRWLVGGCAMMLVSSWLLAKDPNAKAVYCTQAANGEWSLHRFKPLIAVQGGTVFAEMTFDGSVLEEVRLRRFYADSELAHIDFACRWLNECGRPHRAQCDVFHRWRRLDFWSGGASNETEGRKHFAEREQAGFPPLDKELR